MLDSIRGAVNTWPSKVLLGLLVVSFAIWGISGQLFGNVGQQDVVQAGDTTVSMNEYRLAYDREMSQLSQRFGSRITSEQAKALGIQGQVLSQLVAGAVLDEQGRRMNLGVSKDKLAHLTASDPAFQGPDGNFDRRRFEYVLQQVGMRPEDYLKSRSQLAVRQQIIDAVTDGMQVPDTLLKAVSLYRGESRTIEYVPVPVSLVQPIEDPSDEVLAKYFDEHKAGYAAPEYRKIAYVKIDPEEIADPASISDDQVRQYYESHQKQYTTSERRTIEQIVFADKDAAAAARQSINSGATFADLVKAQGKTLDDVTLGTFAKDDIADPAIADAAFGLAENQVSNVVDGQFGPVILRVTAIEPAVVKPLEEVSDDIRQELALDEANRTLLDVNDRYEDTRAGGATMKEAAEKLGLGMNTIEAVDRSGRKPDDGVVQDLPQSQELLEQAFATEQGIENEPITMDNNGFLYFEVLGVTPARDRKLEEVRDKVAADWKDEQAAKRLEEKALGFEKQLKDGKTLDEIAAEIGQEKQVKRGLKRQADDPDIGEAGVGAAFGVPKDGVGIFANPAGDAKFLFKVTEVFEPVGAGPESVPTDVKQAISTSMTNDLLDQLVVQLQQRYEVTVNQNAIARAIAN